MSKVKATRLHYIFVSFKTKKVFKGLARFPLFCYIYISKPYSNKSNLRILWEGFF